MKKTCVFCYGKFQPPTVGHEIVFDYAYDIMETVREESNEHIDFRIYSSSTHEGEDKLIYPLDYNTKIKFMRRLFPHYATYIRSDHNASKNIMRVAQDLYNSNYDRLIMVVGQDRVDNFRALFNRINDPQRKIDPESDQEINWKFDSIEVRSAGDRDPSSDGDEGVTGTKARKAAREGNFEKFKSYLPRSASDKLVREIFDKLRSSFGTENTKPEKNKEDKEGFFSDKKETFSSTLSNKKLFNEGDEVLLETGQTGKIIRIGVNYLILDTNEKRPKRVWIHEVKF